MILLQFPCNASRGRQSSCSWQIFQVSLKKLDRLFVRIHHNLRGCCSISNNTKTNHFLCFSQVEVDEKVSVKTWEHYWQKLTSFLISHSRFRMQSSFLLRQRCAAMRFLLRRLTSWINSSCSEVSLCIFTNIWKSFRGRFVIWSTGKGSFTWKREEKKRRERQADVSFIIQLICLCVESAVCHWNNFYFWKYLIH